MPDTAPDPLFLAFQQALAGRYSLERELGRGGMGIVYLAREVRLDRFVALKLLPPRLAALAGPRERFLREARTAARLSHPHIIQIYAVDEVGEFVFFAMAYVDGETLTERVQRRGPLSAGDAGRMLREVAWALGHAHTQGVIHRDVKPDNVMLEAATGRAMVGDFGIASQVAGAAGLDGGDVIGTPEFMAPEQVLGEGVDARSDLYALGLVGWFALAGRCAIDGGKPTEVLAKQVSETLPRLADVVDGVPRRLGQAIDQCLAKERGERPESAAVLAERLSVALEQKKELPVALRVFVKRGGRLGGMGGLLYMILGVPFEISLAGSLAPAGLQVAAAFLALGGGLTVVPLAMLAARARRFLASGFDPQDLDQAFRIELEQGREERLFEYGRKAGVYERVVRLLFGGSVAVGATAAAVISASSAWYQGGAAGTALLWSMLTGVTSAFLWLTRLNRRVDLDTRIWSWVWRGPIGRALFAIARPFVGKRALAPGTHRATELALSLAVEKLFDELPRATRQQLHDLPDVVKQLEADAQRMRARLEELNEALAAAPASAEGAAHDRITRDLEAQRELVQQRLKEAVAALETIRLNLLKLHAGTGSVQSLTTDLSLAREAAAEVDRLLEGQREADAL